MMKKKNKLLVSLIFTLSLSCLLGCQNGTSTDTKSEVKETIDVEEKQTYASVIGIENASVSPFNKLTNFEEFERMLEEKKKEEQKKNEVVDNKYEETVYVDNKYYEENNEEPPYIEEIPEDKHDMSTAVPEPDPIPETEPPIEEEYTCVGTFDITAYTWTGNPMANGEYPYEGCVASWDFPLGTVLYIDGLGTYVVKDRCPTSGVVDIYMDSYNACIQFGRQYRMVYVVN